MRQSRAPRGATRMEDAARHIKGVKSVDGDADKMRAASGCLDPEAA
ncbi:MAG: hypothetical protein HN416_17935 [Nitrospina sp.]|jgi:hypothetical protein|nr:hypothetical protein [Nitrospina sp.]